MREASQISRRRPAGGGVVIAGGGLAGQRCAEALRRNGYEGPVTVVCAEAHRPYDRPPLSKEALAGGTAETSLSYRSAGWYAEQAIELRLGARASGVNLTERRLALAGAGKLRYDWLVIATGSRPRSLPLLEGPDNVSLLRTLDDCRSLRGVLAGGPRLAVVGAGFIGQEVAATARKLGAEVTLIEAAPSPLVGLLGPRLGEWFARLHRDAGVEVLCGRTVERIESDGTVRALELSDGRRVVADHVVVGVGVVPDIEWLAGSGLEAPGGVAVDPHGRTRVDRVLAVGDAASTFDARAGGHVPGSHWEAAARQGARAARVILGLDPGSVPLTSFWTDQYGTRIQYLGHARLADAVEIDGEPERRSFTATFTRDGCAVAALIVGRPRALPSARSQIEKGSP